MPKPDVKEVMEKYEGRFFMDLLKSFVMGSLSSSCCFIQIGLNMLSSLGVLHIGCAGFNTVLGPIRSYSRTITIIWLCRLWLPLYFDGSNSCCIGDEVCVKESSTNVDQDAFENKTKSITVDPPYVSDYTRNGKEKKKRLMILCVTTFFTLFLSFLPELIMYSGGSSLTVARKAGIEKEVFTIDNMGCEACVKAVEKILINTDGVIYGEITDFATGRAEIIVADGLRKETNKWNSFYVNLNARLDKHGYELHHLGWTTKLMKIKEEKEKSQGYFGLKQDML